jgi:hypothetical protein
MGRLADSDHLGETDREAVRPDQARLALILQFARRIIPSGCGKKALIVEILSSRPRMISAIEEARPSSRAPEVTHRSLARRDGG